MEASLLDVVTNAFVSALQGGLSLLSLYSIPLLAAFSLIAFSTQTWPLLASGSGMAAEAASPWRPTANPPSLATWGLRWPSPCWTSTAVGLIA